VDKCSFYNKVNEVIAKAPHLFALETDSKANNEMIKGIESYYDVKLPEAYEDFVSQYGGGYFGFIVVYSCDDNGMFYIKDRVSKKEVIENAFLPVVDFETGDFLGFEIKGGVCQSTVKMYSHEDNKLVDTGLDFYQILLKYGLNIKY